MNGAGPNPKDVVPCKACGAELVWLRSFNRKTQKYGKMPVNVLPTRKPFRGPNAGELDYIHGTHESHWGTCTEPDRFRRNR